MWSPIPKNIPIALEVGAGALRALQLKQNGDGVCIDRWYRRALTPVTGKGKEGEQEPAWKSVRLCEQGQFTGRDVVVSLSPPEMECFPLRVPANLLELEKSKLMQALSHEVTRHVSSDIANLELDYWRLSPSDTEGPNMMIAAAQRPRIQEILEWLDRQHLVCRRIDLAPLTALRACLRLTQGDPEAITGALDIGRRESRLYIGLGDVPVYIRSMRRGGDEMTQAVSAELGVDWNTAERFKCHYGIDVQEGQQRSSGAVEDANQIDEQRMAGILLSVLRPMVRSLSEEIKRSFHYALEFYPGRPINGLHVIGGGANLKGICSLLEGFLGIPVRRIDEVVGGSLAESKALPQEIVMEMINPLGLSFGEIAA